MSKTQYKTKQMIELLTFLQSVQGSHVTVNDICSYFETKGIAVGTTTVYRHLAKMVKEGLVAKYVIDGTSSACFEYIGKQNSEADTTCYHCKCEKCGKVIHLECEEMTHLGKHMLDDHGFQWDFTRTVFYGICQQCREK